jgi:ABC-2 type transport system permease protein
MRSVTGTGVLLRQNLRRDRLLVPVWLVVLAGLVLASAAATPGLYATEAERIKAAQGINDSPAIVALYGPILDVTSEGELAMTKMTVLYAAFAAILFVVIVRRHTRVEEESGRAELVGGTAVGRDAPLAAAVAQGAVVSVVLGLLVALANIAGGLDPAGSLVFGAVWIGTGLVATGIAAVCCQLSASARTCATVAAAVLGALFVLRAVGDAADATWVSWLSPFGWNTQVRVWSGTRWWMLALYPVLAAALVCLAQSLRGRRDVGAGLVAARPGPATGSPRLADAISLSVRVHSTALAVWTGAVAVLGLLFGVIAPGLDDLLDSEAAQDLIDRLGGEMLAAVLSMVAIVVSCFAVSVVSHAGADETGGRTEEVLATATSRTRWLAASVLVAVGGSLWLLLVTGVTLWIGYASAGGPSPGQLVAAALGWSPAVWVVAGLATLLLAQRGSWAVLGWAWPALFLTLTIVGELLEFPRWLTGLSPYSHVPSMPAEPWQWAPEVLLTAVAAGLLLAAWLRFCERDIG